MSDIRDKLFGKWHMIQNREMVYARIDQINRINTNRLSAMERWLKTNSKKDGEMLNHWTNKLDQCGYELLGIVNGLQGRKTP